MHRIHLMGNHRAMGQPEERMAGTSRVSFAITNGASFGLEQEQWNFSAGKPQGFQHSTAVKAGGHARNYKMLLTVPGPNGRASIVRRLRASTLLDEAGLAGPWRFLAL
jgi:hypothetical protein